MVKDYENMDRKKNISIIISRLLKILIHPCFLIIFLSLLLVIIWFKPGLIMGSGESGLPFYDLGRLYEANAYTWTDTGLGNATGIGVAAIPYSYLIYWFQLKGIPGFILEAAVFWILLIISGTSIWRLTHDLFPELGRRYLYISTIFYWFNPFSLVNVWNRFLYNFIFFWAFLPVALWLFLRGLKNKNYKYPLIFSLATVIFSYSLTSMVFNILLWFMLVSTTFFFWITDEKKQTLFYIKYIFLTFISFVLFNFWWLGQLFNFMLSSGYRVASDLFFNRYSNLATLTSLSKSLGQFINIFRLTHGTFFINGPKWANIFTSNIFVLVEFLITWLAFWVVYKLKSKKEVLFLGLFFIFSLFLVKGNGDPFGEIFEYLFLKFTPLQVFRNPFEKFGFFLPLFLSPLLAIGTWNICCDNSVKKFRNIIYIGLLLILTLALGFPFWSGKVFTSIEGREGLRSYGVEVPKYYDDVNRWLSSQAGEFRFISLPIGGEGITYSWNKPYSGVELSSELFEIPNVSFNTTIPFYETFVTALSKYQINRNLMDFFQLINAKYILFRQDIDFMERKMADPKRMLKALSYWESEGFITKIYEKGKLSVYQVDDSLIWPKIYSTKQWVISNENDIGLLSNYLDNFPEEKTVILPSEFSLSEYPYQKAIFSPEHVFIQKVIDSRQNNLSDEEIMAKLFYVRHLPNEWHYPLVRLREKLEEINQGDYMGTAIYKIGILGKRAVEIYKLRKGNYLIDTINEAENDYLKELSSMESTFSEYLNKNELTELINNSLLYQYILLNRVGSTSTERLSDILINLGIKPKYELPVSDKEYVVSTFKVPYSNKYSLNINNIKIKNIIFDGSLIENSQVFVEKGSHEIAYEVENNSLKNEIINIDNILISDSSITKWPIDIPDMPTTYEIDFDYRFVNGKSFDIRLVQDIDKSNSPIFFHGINRDKDSIEWRNFKKEFTTTPGANKGNFEVIPAIKTECKCNLLLQRKCWEKRQFFKIEIRNFKMSKINLPKSVLVLNNKNNNNIVKPENSTIIKWEKIDPTFYKIYINKIDNQPEWLIFSELFDSGWRAVYQDGTNISSEKHFLANVYANAWIIDRFGEYEIDIKFTPQSFFAKGKIISIVSIAGGLIYLFIYYYGKKEYKRKNN